MAVERRGDIADALRGRVLRGLASGALEPGARLPSTREVASDLRADPRVVAAAYRVLAAEGLVALRERSGVFVAAGAAPSRRAPAATGWVADALLAARAHGVNARAAIAQLRTLTATDGIRAVVAATTADQTEGLVRELREDFGLEARGVLVDPASRLERWPRALERASLVLTTQAHADRLARLHRGARRPLVVAGVRVDFGAPEWRLLVRGIAYVYVADPRFLPVMRQYLVSLGAGDGVQVRVAGRDRVDDVPADAPTYVTEAARQVLGRTRLPGQLVPPARILDDASARALLDYLIRRNVERR